MNEKEKKDSPYQIYLDELFEILTDPIHKRIIKNFQDNDPISSMEDELGKVLLEIIADEN